MRIAAIDIGTNSVRSVIVDAPIDGPRATLDDEKAYTRLGRGLNAVGKLSDKAMDETVEALSRMLDIAEQFEVTRIRVVATAAVRRASNGDEFLAHVHDRLGFAIEVISAKEEGRLAFLSAAESADITGRAAVIDLGGGSIEIVRSTDRQIESITSLPLGAVILSERYHTEDPIPRKVYKRLVKHVRRALKEELGDRGTPVQTLVGSGGTINAIGAIVAARRNPNLALLQGYEIKRADVAHVLAELTRSSDQERRTIKGLPESRVDIIVAGVVVLDETMRQLGANTLWINTHGIRAGLVIDIVEQQRGTSATSDRMDAVRAFGRHCHHDTMHAEQVRTLSLMLFDALSKKLQLETESRPLLEAAALLHDVGYHIAYEKHHRHSHHLISYANLPGFSSRDRRLIAGIARYHRGALPKSKHEALQGLSKDDRQTVMQLGALLRLADGLDRSRAQRISSVRVKVKPSRLELLVKGEGPLDVELHGAQRKADMFEYVFDRRLDVFADDVSS